MAKRSLRGAPSVVLSSLLFAVMAAVARSLSGPLSAGQLTFTRMVVGLAVAIGIFLVTRTGPDFSHPRLLALRGFLGGFAVALYFVAIEYMEVGPATLLNNTAPAYAGLFAALFLGERLTSRILTGLAVAMAGAALVIWSTLEPGRGFHVGLGATAGLLSGVVSGAAVTVIRALRRDTNTLSVLFSFMLIGSIISFPLAAIRPAPAWSLLPGALLVGLLSLGAQLLLTNAYGFVPTVTGSALSLLTPVFSWTLGVAFLGEALRPVGIAGAAICIFGVLLSSRASERSAPGPEQAKASPPPLAR
jgi:drug/metabolite transporter (DMT)-like permease